MCIKGTVKINMPWHNYDIQQLWYLIRRHLYWDKEPYSPVIAEMHSLTQGRQAGQWTVDTMQVWKTSTTIVTPWLVSPTDWGHQVIVTDWMALSLWHYVRTHHEHRQRLCIKQRLLYISFSQLDIAQERTTAKVFMFWCYWAGLLIN